MIFKNCKIKGGAAALLVLFLAGQALAGNVAVRGGFTPAGYSTGKFTFDSGGDGTTVYDTNGATPLAVGYAVECYWVGANGNINDPGYGDDLLIGSVNFVGDDADAWNAFSATAGKFYHDFSGSHASFTSGSNIYFRVWNNASVQGGGAYFGESNFVTAAYDGSIMPLPTNHGLSALSTVLPQSTPEAPTLGTVTPHAASPGGSPGITINANSAVHGRWYEFEVSSPEAGSGATFVFNGHKTGTVTNTRHVADHNTGSTKGTTITLNQTDDNKWVKVRARAVNDYGPGAWVVGGPYFIPQTADPNVPVAVTDLRISQESGSLVLSWSAPYDEDRYGSLTTCVLYDVRVSGEPIVDYPISPFISGETNPLLLSNWISSVPIGSYFTPVPVVPAPAAYGTPQSVTISNAPAGLPLHFALKARDDTGNWSYVSNVVSLGGGGGGAGSADNLTIAFNISGNVELNWSGNAATYEVWAAGSEEVYSLLAGELTGTSYTDAVSSAVRERYYQVRIPGGGAAPQTVGKYTFSFVKETGKTGINTFTIPFGSQVSGRNNAIAAADDVIYDIGTGYVEYVGRWNEAEQKAEGRVVYTADRNNWYGPNFAVQRGGSYQLSISNSVNWSIVGRK